MKIKGVFFLWICFLCVGAQAENLRLISIGVAPWAHFNEDSKEYVGVFPDLVRELEKRIGEKIDITLTPYARINRELETGRQDCAILITEKDRGEITDLGALVFNMPLGVIPNQESTLTDYNDLYGLTISVLRSLDISPKFNNDDKLKKEFDTSYDAGLRKMSYGRLDAIAGAIPTIEYLAKSKGLDNVLGKPLLISLVPIYIQCSKKTSRTQEVQQLNAAMDSMRDESVVDDIVSMYWEYE